MRPPVLSASEPGRRPITIIGLGLFAILGATGLYHGAPWWIWAVWLPPGTALAWMVVANPVAETRLTDTHWTFTAWHRSRTVPLSDIARVRVIRWADGEHRLRVTLTDGSEIAPLPGALPPLDALTAALSRHGIPVDDPDKPDQKGLTNP